MYVSDLDDLHWIVKLDFKISLTHFTGTRCCWLYGSWPQLCTVLSTHPIPHPPLFSGMIVSSSLQKECNRVIRFAIFCVSIHDLCSQLRSEFNVWYLDDDSGGGSLEGFRHNLEIVQHVRSEMGLHLNHQKSKVICTKPVNANPIFSAIPGVRVRDPESIDLLAYSIGDTASITSVINDKIHHLTILGERLQHLTMQDALLLHNSFANPKPVYVIQTSPSFLSPSLQIYDESLKSIVTKVTSINLDETA